jgi:hypothetical protein
VQKLAELRAKVSYQGTISVVGLSRSISINLPDDRETLEESRRGSTGAQGERKPSSQSWKGWITSFVIEGVTDHRVAAS